MAMSSRPAKRYSITLPAELARQAEELAKQNGWTMSELMQQAFSRYYIEEAEGRLLADPQRPQRLSELRRVIREIQREAKAKGLDKMTTREIDAEIRASRKKIIKRTSR